NTRNSFCVPWAMRPARINRTARPAEGRFPRTSPMSSTLRQLSLSLALIAGAAGTQSVRAQPPQQGQAGPIALSLADAVQIGERESEAMRVAAAGAGRARGLHMQARSQLFPDVNGSLTYQRAIQSQFEEIGKRLGGGGEDDTSSTGGGND